MGGHVFWWPESGLPSAKRDLLLASAKEMNIPPVWHRIVHRAPSYPDAARMFKFVGVAKWLGEEPALGRLLHRNLADYYLHESQQDDGVVLMGDFIFAARPWGDLDLPDLSAFGPDGLLAK